MADVWDDEEQKKQKAYEQELQDEARADPDGFLNLQRYVGVNEDKGASMAKSAVDQVTTQAEGVKSDVDKAKSEFDTAKSAATLDNPYSYAQGMYVPNENGGGFAPDQTTSGKGKGAINDPNTIYSDGGSYTYENNGADNGGYDSIYEWDPDLTEEQAAAKSKQTYTGPEGLGGNDLGKRSVEASGFADDVGTGTGLASRAKQLYGAGAEGSYGAGKSAYDALLAGATGGADLAAVQSKYGGLDDYVLGEQEAAAKAAAEARATTEQNAGYYGQVAGKLHDAGDSLAALKASQDENDAQYGKDREGKESWDDYINNNRFENTMKTIANYTDPIAAGLHATGNKSAEDAVNPGLDAYVNKNYGGTVNSNKIDWHNRMPGANDEGRKLVYDSLTTAELRKVENMSPAQQERFLYERLQQVYKVMKIKGQQYAERGSPNRKNGASSQQEQIRQYMPWYNER